MKRPTLNDIAREVGLSKNTVSLALRGSPRLPVATRNRVRQVARRLGYQPNPTVAHLMAQLRASQTPRLNATLALINANEDPMAFRRHPTIPTYVEGCVRRAKQRGYALDEFWIHDEGLRGPSLARTLKARNIAGAIVVGLMKTNELPDHFRPIWEQFACVITGARTRRPALSFACVDHHALVLRAFECAHALGYRRPALVLDQVIDELVEGRFSSGYLVGHRSLLFGKQSLLTFYEVTEARRDPAVFVRWFKRERPDVLFSLYHETRDWLEAAGFRVPEQVGLIQLEWRPSHADWAGMVQHNDVVGDAAVDMVIGMIHQNEIGVPEFPRATLIGASWRDGETVMNIEHRTLINEFRSQ